MDGLIGVLINLARKFFAFLRERSARNQALGQIRQGTGIFSTWNYTPAEWAVLTEEFPKLRSDGGAGKVLFTERFIYLANDRKEVLHEVAREMRTEGEGRHLTEVRLLSVPPNDFVTFRVRTKKIARDMDGKDKYEEKCDVDNLKIVVPGGDKSEAGKIVKFYQQIIDNNAAAVSNVMPRSGGLGLYGG